MGWLLDLASLGEHDRERVGDKAWRLGQLAAAGIAVPAGKVLTVEAFRAAEGSRAPFLPAEVERALRTARSELGNGLLAVRSSGTHEDLADRTLAGLYHTTLGVASWEELVRAVRDSCASLRSEAARARLGPAADAAGMAVIIQLLVAADASGVLFTLNPLTGREEEMLVEATWGLGETLVAGRVNPDRAVVDFWDGSPLAYEVGPKRRRRVVTPHGVREEPVPEAEASLPVLDDGQLRELAALGRRVQEVFGYPQDVEWALAGGRFFVLQSRPVTAFRFAPDFGQWTSANFREVMPGFASILSQSMSFEHEFGLAMEESLRRLRLWRRADRGVVWARTIFGHGYWNVGATKRVLARLPGFRERIFDRTVGIEPLYEGDGRVTPYTPATILRALPTLLALGRAYRRLLGEAAAFTAAFDAEEPSWDGVDPEALDDGELGRRVVWAVELHARANRWALLVSLLGAQAQDDFQAALTRLNAGLSPPVSEARLLTGLTAVATVRPALELWRLSRLVREAGASSPAELGADGRFWEEFRAFLRAFRYMADVDEDLACPRWDENPDTPLGMLQGYLGAGPEDDPAAALERQRRVREEEAARALEALGRGVGGAIRARRFMAQYRLVKEMCWWREETRVYLSRARYHTRRVLLEQGKRWARDGLFERPDDIFWMTRADLLALAGGEGSWDTVRARVRRHRALPHLYRNFRPPLAIDPGAVTGPRRRPSAKVHRGLGCSAGTGTGQACVLRSLEDAVRLKRGDVLVAAAANPAWIPLFGLVSAIVLEEGGLLSHSAVVARELGVPAVLQVDGATAVFREGQRLRVDGLGGTVEVLD